MKPSVYSDGEPQTLRNSPKASPSALDTSFIAALKGKQANNSAPVAVESDPALELPPLVSPRAVNDEELYPISTTMPVNEAHLELARIKAEYTVLEETLILANSAITSLHNNLIEANNNIASLLMDRTSQMDRMIAALRQMQADGIKLAPVAIEAGTLKDVFSKSNAMSKAAASTEYNDGVMHTLVDTLKAFQAASKNAFTFGIQTVSRPDFWTQGGYGDQPEGKFPGKLMLLELVGAGQTQADVPETNKFAIVAVADRVHFLPFSRLRTREDRAQAFLNNASRPSPLRFFLQGGDLWYINDSDSNKFDGGYTDPAKFVNEFCARNLSSVMTPECFTSAIGKFKAMGLMP